MSSSALPLPLYATNNTSGGAHHPTSSVTLTRKRTASRLRGHRHSRSGDGSGSHSFSPFDSLSGESLLQLIKRSPVAFLSFFAPSNLTARARTTNLAVLLLVIACALSFVYNVKFYLHEHPLKGERDRLPLSIRATLPQNNVPPLNPPKNNKNSNKQQNRLKNVVVQAASASGTHELVQAHGASHDAASKAASGASWLSAAVDGPGQTVNFAALDHMIMVPGHAVWKGRTADEIIEDENWVLEEMQKGGSVQTFVKHILKGVELALEDPSSLLIFSGGQTRTTAQETEGDSYYRVSHALNAYDPTNALIPPAIQDNSLRIADKQVNVSNAKPIPLFPRATTEQFAMDSYQNLLFSLCRFKEVTGRYPARVTVIGFGMKRSRFTDVHRAAVKFPLSGFTYVGIDDQGETGQSYLGEKEYGLKPYTADVYGCHGLLLLKRRGRNPFRRIHPYFTSNAGLRDLLEYCPDSGVQIYPGSLPWEHE